MKKIAALLSIAIALALFGSSFSLWRTDSAWLKETLKNEAVAKKAYEERHQEKLKDYLETKNLQQELRIDELKLDALRTEENIARLKHERPNIEATYKQEQTVDADQEALRGILSYDEMTDVLSPTVPPTDILASGEVEKRRDRRLELLVAGCAFLIGGVALLSGGRFSRQAV